MSLTKEQWFAHPTFRKELAELLDHPTLRVALDLVLDYGISPVALPTNVDLVHFAALTGARRDGYVECLTNLRLLAKNPTVRPDGPKPWEDPTLTEPAPTEA